MEVSWSQVGCKLAVPSAAGSITDRFVIALRHTLSLFTFHNWVHPRLSQFASNIPDLPLSSPPNLIHTFVCRIYKHRVGYISLIVVLQEQALRDVH
jgi:hypothetical protein